MEPLVSYSGLELTLVEFILGAALVLFGALLTLIFARRGSGAAAAQREAKLENHLTRMTERQTELQGRLAQMAEESAARETQLRESLDTRLNTVSERVGQSIEKTQERNSANLKQLHERLALIDRAQKNIEMLSGEVSGLQSLLSNKQSRGAFGEKQMQDLVKDFLPPHAYTFQATLSNNNRVDALLHLPNNQGNVAVDSKFPMEAWRRFIAADNTPDSERAGKDLIRDLTKHINDIAGKYLIFGETNETAMLFLPSEAIYAELHSNFPAIIDKAFQKRVMIVSPTTFMATLHTMQALMNDAAMRENAFLMQKEVKLLMEDVSRLDGRIAKLQRHHEQAADDMRDIKISTGKITKRAGKIDKFELQEDEIETASNISQISPHSISGKAS